MVSSISEEQRKEAEAYLRAQEVKKQQEAEFNQYLGTCTKEADELIKFLTQQGLKTRKSILAEQVTLPNGQRTEKTFSVEYFSGVDLHYKILTHAKEIMKIVKNISKKVELNNLENLEDSIRLCVCIMQLKKMTRVVPHANVYPNPSHPDAKKPKALQIAPRDQQSCSEAGFYLWVNKEGGIWMYIYLALVLIGILSFVTFRAWPDWLKIGMWYVSWYLLVFLIGTAIVRVILWFVIWHVGIDFWLFPNYWVDSNNPLDSFWPLLEVTKRDDMFNFTWVIVRLASVAIMVSGMNEFLKEPENLEVFLKGSDEIWNDVFEWGQNKFMGVPDNSTQVQVKKSARQIYAEAFMEDEQMFGMNKRRFYAEDPSAPETEGSKTEEVDSEKLVDIDSPTGDHNEEAVNSEDALDALLGTDDDEL